MARTFDRQVAELQVRAALLNHFIALGCRRPWQQQRWAEFALGKETHVLGRGHATKPSHVMMNGGNILIPQRALGHHNLTMTMRYAHLSPDHLSATRKLNPLRALNLC
ncbi:hypothetical protein BI347_04875 [Chromobacterium sphagni]|uniref:Tyr recombinase domain-containing protein n=1 Tax=Chromobacterium sphagni TaxID=1903179 RepID=A0A1S1X068_9NEIS|nr:hypothetical protein BI347_04875 [Chromobacterium sphagni]OHX19881.1 hypothetical protein BI344_16205 [Chromobacterium sphagni]